MTNVMTAAAGFLLASKWHINWPLFLALLFGSTLVIASACVWNNLIDRELDRKMLRTKKRALPSGKVSIRSASILAALLGALGFWILFYTNWLTVAIIAIAYFSYVVVYGFAKRRTIHSTLIGTVPGAASLVAGYIAVTNYLDSAAIILFLIMVAWQMAHFYAISIYRLQDYTAAGVPVMPAKKGLRSTKLQMLFYIVLFVDAAILLTIAGYTGYIYLIAVEFLGIYWIWKAVQGFRTRDNEAWARDVFKFSLVVLLALSVLLSVGSVLP